jgi:hypothetical protein
MLRLHHCDVEVASLQGHIEQSAEDVYKLRRLIEGELANYFSSFCVSESLIAKSWWLTYLIDEAFTSGDVAISLNYDCVLEGALDCRGKWSPNEGYGSSPDHPLVGTQMLSKSPVAVLKIHGSANFMIGPVCRQTLGQRGQLYV